MQVYLFYIIGLIVLLTALEWFMPTVFRPTNLFGVTVAPDTAQQPEGRALIRRWRVAVTTMGLVAVGIALAMFAFDPLVALLARSGVILLLDFGLVALYVIFHNQAQALAVPAASVVRTASLGVRPRVTLIPWWWEALPLALIGVTVVILSQQYAAAPAIIPTHWDLNNHVNATAPKTIGSFFALVWVQLGLWVMLTVIAATVGMTRIGNNASTGTQQFRLAMARYLFFVKSMVIVLLGSLAVLSAHSQVTNTPPSGGILVEALAFVFVIIVVGGTIFVRYGQSGWRVDQRAGLAPASDNTPDSAWKGGLIYYNPNDPALFVERRSGMGFTLNFGHRASWLFVGGLILLILAVSVLPTVLSGSR